MKRLARIASLPLLAAALLLASPEPAKAGKLVYSPWVPKYFYKSDLKINALFVSPNYGKVLVFVQNVGKGPSTHCHISATNYTGGTTTGIEYLTAMQPGETRMVNVWVGPGIHTKGSVTAVYVDVYNAVNETNESNNNYVLTTP